MKPELIHILDQSVCLTRRQMKDYLAGTMLNEEQHAAEVHLSACPLCRMAMDGFEEHTEEALAAISSLNSGFLKEHYDAVTPQVHLNSVAPSIASVSGHRVRKNAQPLWRNLGIAATVILALGTLWYLQRQNGTLSKTETTSLLADNSKPSQLKQSGPATADYATAPSKDASTNNKEALIQKPASKAGVILRDSASYASNYGYLARKSSAPAGLIAMDSIRPASVSVKSSEQIEKLVNQQTADVVSLSTGTFQEKQGGGLSIGGGRSTGNMVIVDGVQYPAGSRGVSNLPPAKNERKETTLKNAKNKSEVKDDEPDAMEKGDALADKGKYTAAAGQYKKEMAEDAGTRAHRHQAGILAARAYINAGQKAKAIAVLQKIIDEGGAQKRVAKRMLKDLQEK